MSETLAQLEETALVPADATEEQIAAALNRMESFSQRLTEAEAILEQSLIEWIEANGRDIELGTVRYYVGTKKTWKCAAKWRAIETAMNLATSIETGECNESAFSELLTSDPVKRGAVTKLAEERGIDITGIWTCEEEPELREGKPVKRLQKIDTKFIR